MKRVTCIFCFIMSAIVFTACGSDGDGNDALSWQKMAPELRVTSDAGNSGDPSLSWSGSEFGVSWEDNRYGNNEILFARLSSSGVKISGDVRMSNDAAGSYNASLSWTGSEFGTSWEDSRHGNDEIYFAGVQYDSTISVLDTRVISFTSASLIPSLVWTGSEYGISWYDLRDSNAEIYFARLSNGGSKIGSDLRLTFDAAGSYNSSLSWTGSEFGVSWEDNRDGDYEIYFARVSASGNTVISETRITEDAAGSYDSSLAWTGSEYGVSWEDRRDGNAEIYFARISASGDTVGPDVRVTSDGANSYYPSLSWTGGGFGISWRDDRDGNAEIYFAWINPSGAKYGPDLRVTSDAGISNYSSLCWSGSVFGVAWEDDRDGNTEIYFARIGLR